MLYLLEIDGAQVKEHLSTIVVEWCTDTRSVRVYVYLHRRQRMARGFKYHFKLAVGKESPSERVPSHTLFNIEYRFRTFESGPHFEKRDYDVLGT